MATLNIHIVEFKYCPVCGKGLFRKYVEVEKESLEEELKRIHNNKNIFKARCRKCKAKITIEYGTGA